MDGIQNSNPCLEHCGIMSHLPGTLDLVLLENLDHALISMKDENFKKPFFHLGISYDYENEKFSWDDSGDSIHPLLWKSQGDRTWPIVETLIMAHKVIFSCIVKHGNRFSEEIVVALQMQINLTSTCSHYFMTCLIKYMYNHK